MFPFCLLFVQQQDIPLSLETLQDIRTDVAGKEYGLATTGKTERMVRFPHNK